MRRDPFSRQAANVVRDADEHTLDVAQPLRHSHPGRSPPLTTMFAPVIYPAASEARKTQTPAISSAVTTRPSGLACSASLRTTESSAPRSAAARVSTASIIGDSTEPGLTQ